MILDNALKCDMTRECDAPISHIDDRGYIYCANHGVDRQWTHRCRKLRPHELNRLNRGEQVASY